MCSLFSQPAYQANFGVLSGKGEISHTGLAKMGEEIHGLDE